MKYGDFEILPIMSFVGQEGQPQIPGQPSRHMAEGQEMAHLDAWGHCNHI